MKGRHFLVFGFCLVFSAFPSFGEALEVLNSVLNVHHKDLSGPITITGNWKFRSIESGEEAGDWQFVPVPSAWNEVTGSALGSGEYLLYLMLPREVNRPLALQIPHFNEVMELYVDGKLLFSSGHWLQGRVGYSQSIVHLPSSRNILEIRIRFKNTFFRSGGLYRAIRLGYESDLQKAHVQDVVFEGMILGALLIIALMNLFLSLNKFPQKYSVFLGLSALFYSVRGMLSEPLAFPAFLGASDISFFYRLEYLVSYLGIAAIMPFLSNITSWDSAFKRGVQRVLLAVYLLAAGVTLFLPLNSLSRSVYLFQLSGLSCMLFGLWVTFPGRVKKDTASLLIFLGAIIFLLLVSLDIAALDFLSLHFMNTTQLGMLLFIIPLGFALSIRVSHAYTKAEILSRELEKEVALQTRELKESNEKLKELSTTDPLTGIRNRRSFFELAELNLISCRQREKPLSLLALDLDHFKKINDNYGHKSGDDALCFFTSLCNSMIRDTDIFGRVGGEEFSIVLPFADLKVAREIAERIRGELEVRSSGPESLVPPLTVSIGVVCVEPEETLSETMERADILLYKAKEAGRNRVEG